MKKDLLTQVQEDLRKREDKNYNLLYELLTLMPSVKAENYIRYNEESNKLYIGSELIGSLSEITFVKQNDSAEDEIIELEFEDLDINHGVVYKTRKLKFQWSRENSWDNYTLEDWVENPTYRDEIETEQAKQQYESEYEYTPVLEGEMPF